MEVNITYAIMAIMEKLYIMIMMLSLILLAYQILNIISQYPIQILERLYLMNF